MRLNSTETTLPSPRGVQEWLRSRIDCEGEIDAHWIRDTFLETGSWTDLGQIKSPVKPVSRQPEDAANVVAENDLSVEGRIDKSCAVKQFSILHRALLSVEGCWIDVGAVLILSVYACGHVLEWRVGVS